MAIENDNAQPTNTTTPQTTTSGAGGDGAAAGAQAGAAGAGGDGGNGGSLKDAITKALNAEDGDPPPQPTHADSQGGDDAGAGDDDGEGDDDGAGDAGAEGDDGQGEGAGDDDLKAPEGINTKARERFEKLVERVKETDRQYQELDGKFRGIETLLKGTGATPELWGRVLTAMRYANSGDTGEARRALEILDGYRAEVARVAGVPIEGVDMLSDFPDLRQKVDNGDVDEASAAEIAASRRAQARSRDATAQQHTQQQADAAVQEARTKAGSDLDALGADLAGKDVDYPKKFAILRDRGVIDRIAKNVAPQNWVEVFRSAYDALGDVAAAQRTPAPPAGEQPMRRSSKSGSGPNGQPKTVAEAVRMAVNE